MVNVLLWLTPEQWAAVQQVCQKTGKDPDEVLYRALDLGWPALQREAAGVPKPPVKLQVVK
jgi:hypothetical protein